MPLEIPKYIIDADIQDNNIQYKWDDWNQEHAEQFVDEDLADRLSRVAPRAILALMCGSAEWIVHRFAHMVDDPAPSDYLEAAWATVIDTKYSGHGSITWQDYREHWTGPVKGPISRALLRLEVGVQQLHWQREDPIFRAKPLISLVSYVIPKPEIYKKWYNQVTYRLESLYPRIPGDEFGDVVPRQALDIDQNFNPQSTEELVNTFLSRLNPEKNRFLSPPKDILDVTWEGPVEEAPPDFIQTPYRFNLEADRLVRNEL